MTLSRSVSLVLSGLTSAGEPIIQNIVICDDYEREISPEKSMPICSVSGGETVPTETTFKYVENDVNNVEHKVAHVENVTSAQADDQGKVNVLEVPIMVGIVQQRPEVAGSWEEKLIASNDQFERKLTPSLAAALMSAEHAPSHKTIMQFVEPSGDALFVESAEPVGDTAYEGKEGPLPSNERIVADILQMLIALQMKDSSRHVLAVRRLQNLEKELREVGALCPPDDAVSQAVADLLATAPSSSDVRIHIKSSHRTTSTKTVYESGTPAMDGLEAESVQQLQQQLINSMSFASSPTAATPKAEQPVTEQKHESMAEGFTNEDGSVVVSKKMTRTVTTTRTATSGEPSYSNAGDLIRLKVNEQVYSGSVDPEDQHIHLVPVEKVKTDIQQQ